MQEYIKLNIQTIPFNTKLCGFITDNGEYKSIIEQGEHTLFVTGLRSSATTFISPEFKDLSNAFVYNTSPIGSVTNVFKTKYAGPYHPTSVYIIESSEKGIAFSKKEQKVYYICSDELREDRVIYVSENAEGVFWRGDAITILGKSYSFALDKNKIPHLLSYTSGMKNTVLLVDDKTYRAIYFEDIAKTTTYTLIREVGGDSIRDALFKSTEFSIKDKFGYEVHSKMLEAFNKYV